MASKAWKAARDPLFRGDLAAGVAIPKPRFARRLVSHILYLDGPGRDTPYLSTTEDETIAERFAGRYGHVFKTDGTRISAAPTVKHFPRKQLLANLKGTGQGECAWPSPHQVMLARVYVEKNAEHVLDFRGTREADVDVTVARLFGR